MAAQGSFIANAADVLRHRLARVLGYSGSLSSKHDYATDYGWIENLDFRHFYRMYCRSGIAASAVSKTIAKTWQSNPELWESEEPGNSPREATIARHFARRGIWRGLMEADRRSMVGCYAGAIILLRDGMGLDQPVGPVRRGVETLAGIIPAWEGQLMVAEWDQDRESETYCEPLFYQFNEQAVGEAQGAVREQLRIHRDRVLIFSEDGTINGRSTLESGFNDLTDAEKIKGAGGEGFWKSARGAPIIEAPKGVSPADVIRGMGVATSAEVIEELNDQVGNFNSGFDQALMLGGFSVSPLTITLPQPKEFWEPCVQSFAASMSIPFKVLIGNVTGERASTEDADEWAQTCMSRRENRVMPVLQEFVDRLVAWGVLDRIDWVLAWTSLQEASPDDKLDRAAKMSAINQQSGGDLVFMADEIREEAGYARADEVEGFAEWLAEREERRADGAEDGDSDAEPARREMNGKEPSQ